MARKTASRRAAPAKTKPTTRSTPGPAPAPAPAATPEAPQLDARERAARALEAKAEAGDVAAIKAIADGVADRLRGATATARDWRDQYPPHVVDAMLRAANEATGQPMPPDPTDVGARITCPLCNRIFAALVDRKTGLVTGCRPQSGS